MTTTTTTKMTMTLKGNWILGTTIPDLFISSVAGSISYNPIDMRHHHHRQQQRLQQGFGSVSIGGRRDDDDVDDDFCSEFIFGFDHDISCHVMTS